MISLKTRIYCFLLFVFITTSTLSGQSVYGFRGEDRTGIYEETGLLKVWPASGPKLLWEAEGIGIGYSSATVTNDAVYITGIRGDKDVLTAFTQDGKKKWEVEYGSVLKVQNYPESRCTPTVYGDKIFLVSGSGELTCVSTNGKVLWSLDVFKKYSSPVPRFGISESPVVVDNKVIMTPGGNLTTMVAFSADNGNVVWESESLREEAQYVNPLLIERAGKKIIITHTPTLIIAVNSADGKIIWKFNFKSVNANPQDGRNYIQTPIYKDGYLFAANGYGQTAAKIRIFDDRDPELVWKNPEFNPHVGGMVLIGNYLYGSTHDNNSMGRWICADWTTGKTMWITRWYNKGSVIAADGMLYFYEERWGHVGLVKPDSEKFNLVSEFQVEKGTGPYWAHPVIDKGRLFVRHGDYLAVYSLKK
ncbi:MAG TPA: PQQ-binding-like beta-propeller repeat protein [Bacteroidales bacterium]|nr:PQQ-binding-like beta-propeller repeat protein [Bacteroidales bacterium]HPF04085.1 PQQ-binding-like beta-propeller repeat protein [Bacteroidales bacterium]HPJ59016.1 PQQ-binding-like beta-propeller repeat protein [Bacteroidales bacterium]HPR11165.1 PQQ-binding-like beta-propeller repeat protein [Bacteroidales bacterium]HRW86049.1 PQQ-binding-like beta-propeller repeat protein [Bacteroidales bacterium]